MANRRRRKKNDWPQPNNSGPHREPTNVWWCLPTKNARGEWVIVLSNFYEFELQDFAADHPEYIVFVHNEDVENV